MAWVCVQLVAEVVCGGVGVAVALPCCSLSLLVGAWRFSEVRGGVGAAWCPLTPESVMCWSAFISVSVCASGILVVGGKCLAASLGAVRRFAKPFPLCAGDWLVCPVMV